MTKKQEIKKKTDAKINKKKEFIDDLEKNKEELKLQKEKLMRSYADFDNYKKRVQKDRKTNEFLLKKIYLSELLDIKELLFNALEDKDPKKGLKILLNKLEKFLESENINYIDCIEKSFNHELHHAVTTINNPDIKENTIIEEVKKGYMVGEKVLRPSHVIVSKKKCEEEEINE